MEQKGQERPHQENYGRRHPEFGVRNHGNERVHHFYRMPEREEKDPRDQVALPRHDH